MTNKIKVALTASSGIEMMSELAGSEFPCELVIVESHASEIRLKVRMDGSDTETEICLRESGLWQMTTQVQVD